MLKNGPVENWSGLIDLKTLITILIYQYVEEEKIISEKEDVNINLLLVDYFIKRNIFNL